MQAMEILALIDFTLTQDVLKWLLYDKLTKGYFIGMYLLLV